MAIIRILLFSVAVVPCSLSHAMEEGEKDSGLTPPPVLTTPNIHPVGDITNPVILWDPHALVKEDKAKWAALVGMQAAQQTVKNVWGSLRRGSFARAFKNLASANIGQKDVYDLLAQMKPLVADNMPEIEEGDGAIHNDQEVPKVLLQWLMGGNQEELKQAILSFINTKEDLDSADMYRQIVTHLLTPATFATTYQSRNGPVQLIQQAHDAGADQAIFGNWDAESFPLIVDGVLSGDSFEPLGNVKESMILSGQHRMLKRKLYDVTRNPEHYGERPLIEISLDTEFPEGVTGITYDPNNKDYKELKRQLSDALAAHKS